MTPVLLLIPGMLCDERVWGDVVAHLPAARADVRIADVTQGDTVAALADAAWRCLEDATAGRAPGTPVVVAGFSLGGYVAIEMLARPRRAVHGAALLSTQADPETAEASAQRVKTMAAMASRFEAVVEGLAGFSTHEAPPALRARLLAMMRDVGADAALRQTRAIMGRADHRDALRRLRIPVQVLCGREDRITPPGRSEDLAALMLQARLALVPGAGHMLPMEQPAAVAEALAALVERSLAAPGVTHSL